jgi:hypothetical protein
VGTHEKTAYIDCNARACLRRIIDGLSKTGGHIHDDAVYKYAYDAIHKHAGDKRALTRSAPENFRWPPYFCSNAEVVLSL